MPSTICTTIRCTIGCYSIALFFVLAKEAKAAVRNIFEGIIVVGNWSHIFFGKAGG
jgi:hypothetical protein